MRIDQFDRYEKDDRVSYAYRLVFQSHDKTLADKEITPITDAIYKRLEDEGWEIR
jgi:phenylalanyl-tRNA synthetase beta subunit